MEKRLRIMCVVLCGTVGVEAQTVLVREGDAWRFFRGTEAPPADWADPAFDPAAWDWEEGPTGIGYGDGDDATILDDMQNGYLSVYLRIAFDVPDGLEGFAWTLRVRYDDGFVAYLDGQEIARRGLAGTPPAFDEPADPLHEILDPAGFDEAIPLDGAGALLEAGPHVLAAEVHNANLTSSDLSFSAELLATPFLVTAVVPAFGPIEGGGTVSVLGAGFDPEDPPAVRFGGADSPEVVVIGPEELQVVVPAGAGPGPVDVEVEDARGRVTLQAAYRYAGPGQTGLAFDGQDFATAEGFGDLFAEGTFEVWYRRTGRWRFFWQVLLAVEAAGGDDAFRIEVRRNQIRARTWVGGEARDLTGGVGAGTDWHHIAFTFSDRGRRLYSEGALAASDAEVMELPEGARLRLGGAFGDAPSLVGEIESARVWAYERAPEEIRRDRFARRDAGDGVEAAWPLEEGAGPEAQDIGPFGFPLFLGETDAPEGSDPEWIPIEDFPLLAIAAIEPDHGPLEGGNTVRIFGTGFAGVDPPDVRFGPAASPSVDAPSAWELEAVVPPGADYGPVDVEVATTRGTATAPGGYAYAPAAIYTFLREGDPWSYVLGASAPPEDWTLPEFEPGEWDWERGPTGIGYGDGDDATEVPEMQGQYATLYARIDWEQSGGGDPIDYLRLRVRYDDGFVAYLNGEEVARRNVAGLPPAFDELASDQHEITVGAGAFDEEIDLLPSRDLLRDGRNVLAIEVHNVTPDSSDLSISAELAYAAPGAAFVRGDVDGSGALTISDAVGILYALFAGRALPCEEAADVDDDGALGVGDAIGLLEYLFVGGDAPRPPFAEPAPDLDDDDLHCEG